MKKRFAAFTLAEVLITLGIIGIVAAMTLPALIANYQKQQTVVALKKAFSVLYQAVESSEAENGSMQYWDYSSSHSYVFYNTYLKKYLKVAKDYGEVGLVVINPDYTVLKGGKLADYGQWDLSSAAITCVALSDGTILGISYASYGVNSDSKWIYVDINGFKKPNKLGKDLFAFKIGYPYKVAPMGAEYSRDALIRGRVVHHCNNTGNTMYGTYCAALIMKDGWEIKDDYPW